MITFQTETGRRQLAFWASVKNKPLFAIRLVRAHERYPRSLAFSWAGGAGYTSPFGWPHLRRRFWSDNRLYIEWSGFTAHLRLGRYTCRNVYQPGKDAPWLGVTMNANRWL